MTPLTVHDLMRPGEPLHSAQVAAGTLGLHNTASWAVSLRSFMPAFPNMKGGEIALVATENLLRLDPPITLLDVVKLLAGTGVDR